MPPEDPTPAARTLSEPDPEAAAAFVAEGLADAAVVTLFGRCTVEYEGRAAAELAAGDRHLMLKPDGAALVHAAGGQKPVAWQPPGGTHASRVDGDRAVVESRRESPEASLAVRFSRVVRAGAFRGTGAGAGAGADPESGSEAVDVSGTEADLAERVLAEPSVIEPGFRPLATERETPAGAVDVYGEDEAGRTVVLELKRRRAGPDAVGQLDRYVTALERDLHADAAVRGILVAPSVTGRAEAMLAERGLEFVPVTPPD